MLMGLRTCSFLVWEDVLVVNLRVVYQRQLVLVSRQVLNHCNLNFKKYNNNNFNKANNKILSWNKYEPNLKQNNNNNNNNNNNKIWSFWLMQQRRKQNKEKQYQQKYNKFNNNKVIKNNPKYFQMKRRHLHFLNLVFQLMKQ